MLQIFNKISFYRKKCGLTQSELAGLIGVSKNAISAYETNQYNPSLVSAFELCRIFSCSV